MEVLLLKATLAPLLILLTSIAAHRLGPRFGGRLLGLPLSTAPFLVILCVEHGPQAASDAARGAALGQLTVVTFCLVYARLATKMRPLKALPIAVLCGVIAEVVVVLTHSLWLTAIAIVTAVAGAVVWSSTSTDAAPQPGRGSRWDLPSRMAVSGAVVLILTTAAPLLGPVLAGALSALPVLLIVMAPSVHRTAGGEAAASLMYGALASAVGTIAFVLVLSATLVPVGPWVAFALALGGMATGDATVRAARRVVPIRRLEVSGDFVGQRDRQRSAVG
ncbi:hypothetical protein DMH04_33635 [Kibdelosporangium aridum]|uniref:Uncharacterized protein n=1 Tax=Kibdelosporangium aridum TaxID=2030 RepID=A0A428Z1C3_KIBAR|nr:hypothetical protein [Kibdelosporangium aridum]RSM78595.1 hypothetical protein DMH04_33635 [Kibdelosporangium aridum]